MSQITRHFVEKLSNLSNLKESKTENFSPKARSYIVNPNPIQIFESSRERSSNQSMGCVKPVQSGKNLKEKLTRRVVRRKVFHFIRRNIFTKCSEDGLKFEILASTLPNARPSFTFTYQIYRIPPPLPNHQ